LPFTIPGSSPAGKCPTSINHRQAPASLSSSVQALALPRVLRVLPPLHALSKRRPSRRANTTDRRATCNAVDCALRKTPSGLFSGSGCDPSQPLPDPPSLQAPNGQLLQCPHPHAPLRLLKLESDALCRRLSELRDPSLCPRVEEPIRGEGFHAILRRRMQA
ncbi:hypothetical protein BD309DRAFT_1028329, partial [Dichomitus squalens]